MFEDPFVRGLAVGVAATVGVLVVVGFVFWGIRPWIRLKMCGGRGSLMNVFGMRLRGNPPSLIIDAYTALLHSGVDVRLMEVESQYVANRGAINALDDLVEHVREHKRREQLAQEKRSRK